ncbi:circularly permuted type 2 ATP-grasp protein [Neolewinella lacunae]|uniref:Circularly permuted type 2 ATP-grasp protein n=1 Tax=Neolewinella lacunae TaxID=1517758 RepID=A0A923PHB6_9BACT|nr:circularly permuted type 2 ATP-grasp protein [Neolewinella lacunae]MBC6992615.1 circularly permuted type 2 ATP-grasp protein [Neolewinella lacunae]MDN3634356.1 circularly permuted type 2 ATP-grasp protein [Neolewinella lacunae]
MKKHAGLFANYTVSPGTLDEAFSEFPGAYAAYDRISEEFGALQQAEFERLNQMAKLSFLNQGITYAVYTEDGGGTEKVFPFDLFPRVIAAAEWQKLENGLKQRNEALNLFLADVYSEGKILKDRVVPAALIHSSAHYVKQMEGFSPVGNIYTHICGTDLVRHTDGNFYVLEDNLRSPSGVSYVLSNRQVMRRTMYEMFNRTMVEDVSAYPNMLLETLQSVSPQSAEVPRCVLLTPGQYNSAYYEHSLLAQLMGIDLVQGADLFVNNDLVYLKTTRGPLRVDVIYRRIDDAFLDPQVFRKDSMLGVAGLIGAYLKGNVTIVNAPGTGIADDKAICSYVPDMIRYYLQQEPIIENVKTYICDRPEDLAYVLEHLGELVVKPVDMSGGYGVTICDRLSRAELDAVATQIKADPRNYIAQPKIMLSTHATFIDEAGTFAPRHIDLRTFTLLGQFRSQVLKGGLTRVALKAGSLIVNSSQGGGSKDTWVVADGSAAPSQSQSQYQGPFSSSSPTDH